MRKDEATRKKFIELKAAGYSYRYIQKEINVSRPTIAKWCRLYAKEIDREYKRQDRKRLKEYEKQLDREYKQRFKKYYAVFK